MGLPDEHIHPHATGKAANTVAAHKDPQPVTFYAGWFCPFVQRSWIVLEEKGIPYQYREVNPYKKEECVAFHLLPCSALLIKNTLDTS